MSDEYTIDDINFPDGFENLKYLIEEVEYITSCAKKVLHELSDEKPINENQFRYQAGIYYELIKGQLSVYKKMNKKIYKD